jgi:hypothetical protein
MHYVLNDYLQVSSVMMGMTIDSIGSDQASSTPSQFRRLPNFDA